MSKPSKAGAVFVVLFALPFLGMGLALMAKLLMSGGANSIAGAVFAGGFALIGALLIFGVVSGWGKLKRAAAVKDQNPNSPWLWREDWAQSRSLGQNRNRATGLWIATAVVSCLTLPWIYTGLSSAAQKNKPPAFILIGLASFAVLLGLFAIRATIRRERFGKTYFEFDSLPIAPGKKLTGRVELHLATSAQHGIDLRLSCVRRITTGSGKNQSTRDEVLWEQQQNIAAGVLGSGPLGAAASVSFDIPADAYESNYENLRDKILWLLHAQADVPGVDFSEDYELPVFRTGPPASAQPASVSISAFGTSFGGAAAATTSATTVQDEPVQRPATTSAVISTDWNGTQYYFPALRNPLQALILFGV